METRMQSVAWEGCIRHRTGAKLKPGVCDEELSILGVNTVNRPICDAAASSGTGLPASARPWAGWALIVVERHPFVHAPGQKCEAPRRGDGCALATPADWRTGGVLSGDLHVCGAEPSQPGRGEVPSMLLVEAGMDVPA